VKILKNKIISAKKNILDVCFAAQEGHIPSSFSVLNILNVLIKKNFIFKKKIYLNNFILSKGHSAIGYYAILNQYSYISNKDLKKFATFNSKLGGHPKNNLKYYITASTGSLGHGLPIAAGMAFAQKNKKYYVLLGDQECNEGTLWETLLMCSHHKLNNLTIIIDRNYSREEALSLGKLEKKLRVFSKCVFVVNGHDEEDIFKILKKKTTEYKIIIAKTIKGYGIKEMENSNEWHHKFPKNINELKKIKNKIYS